MLNAAVHLQISVGGHGSQRRLSETPAPPFITFVTQGKAALTFILRVNGNITVVIAW